MKCLNHLGARKVRFLMLSDVAFPLVLIGYAITTAWLLPAFVIVPEFLFRAGLYSPLYSFLEWIRVCWSWTTEQPAMDGTYKILISLVTKVDSNWHQTLSSHVLLMNSAGNEKVDSYGELLQCVGTEELSSSAFGYSLEVLEPLLSSAWQRLCLFCLSWVSVDSKPMMEETILVGDDLMMGPPSPLIPPEIASHVLEGVELCDGILRNLFLCKSTLDKFWFDWIRHANSLNLEVQDTVTNFKWWPWMCILCGNNQASHRIDNWNAAYPRASWLTIWNRIQEAESPCGFFFF